MIVILMVFIMVAEEVYAADTPSRDFNVGRAFAHCTKLTKDNYDLWFTGLISTLIGITGVAAMNGVRQFFEAFERVGAQPFEKVEENLKALGKGLTAC